MRRNTSLPVTARHTASVAIERDGAIANCIVSTPRIKSTPYAAESNAAAARIQSGARSSG
ncbi:hypothetical protein WS71_21920 [Burkholderia mayonis]|uniref:Uncharacterized protein n=1 Tax=Burkholderia mayonis TaxID=1385591 RepID=A0A1B4G1Y6_9BURK|nr:hypothetical protein WS71_21920 [Burkholderia mayonis]KVE46993.1 hypothetical protein WS71_20120 [Burkholderia mayonis]